MTNMRDGRPGAHRSASSDDDVFVFDGVGRHRWAPLLLAAAAVVSVGGAAAAVALSGRSGSPAEARATVAEQAPVIPGSGFGGGPARRSEVPSRPGSQAAGGRSDSSSRSASRVPEMLPIPDVTGKAVTDATAILTGAGFNVVDVLFACDGKGRLPGTVSAFTASGYERSAPPGTNFTLTAVPPATDTESVPDLRGFTLVDAWHKVPAGDIRLHVTEGPETPDAVIVGGLWSNPGESVVVQACSVIDVQTGYGDAAASASPSF